MVDVMMSLKPRNVDFDETWAKLKETVSAVVSLRGVSRSVWSARFSDVYALCVAHPEPQGARLYRETRTFLEEHVNSILERVQSDGNDEMLLHRYVEAWREYSKGVAYLNALYSYLNLQHVKRQKASDADIMYGSAASVSGVDQDTRHLEIGELGLTIWERVLIRPLSSELSSRIVNSLNEARQNELPLSRSEDLRVAIESTVAVGSGRMQLYNSLVLEPFLEQAATCHSTRAAMLLATGDVPAYVRSVLTGLDRERALAVRYCGTSSVSRIVSVYSDACVTSHLPTLHAAAPALLRAASDVTDDVTSRADLRALHRLLRDPPAACRPLLDAAQEAATEYGRALLAAPHTPSDAAAHFVRSVLQVHSKFAALFADVFDGAAPFSAALDRACSALVGGAGRGPELLARHVDTLLRRRGELPVDNELGDAILVFKYIDDKDVFQKYYARALAKRLIHQQSASMEQEEAMINRLKAACGYEFTNKLHRMFTDVALSADLNEKFVKHCREKGLPREPNFCVQVLQAGAWPLGSGVGQGGSLPAGPASLATAFDVFYRAAYSGRRLAWLAHLATAELRLRYTARQHTLCASAHQADILLAFETHDRHSAADLREMCRLDAAAWLRQARPLVDAGLLIVNGEVETGELELNLGYSGRRTRVRLGAAVTQASEPGAVTGPSGATCDDDRKMFLQAALVRIMKQRKVLRHNELIQEVATQARGSFAPSVAMIKKCIEALIDKQYLERAAGTLDTYSYLA